MIVDKMKYPILNFLCWNRNITNITDEEVLSIYERNSIHLKLNDFSEFELNYLIGIVNKVGGGSFFGNGELYYFFRHRRCSN